MYSNCFFKNFAIRLFWLKIFTRTIIRFGFSFSNPGPIELSTAGLVMTIKFINKWIPALELASLTSRKKMD